MSSVLALSLWPLQVVMGPGGQPSLGWLLRQPHLPWNSGLQALSQLINHLASWLVGGSAAYPFSPSCGRRLEVSQQIWLGYTVTSLLGLMLFGFSGSWPWFGFIGPWLWISLWIYVMVSWPWLTLVPGLWLVACPLDLGTWDPILGTWPWSVFWTLPLNFPLDLVIQLPNPDLTPGLCLLSMA